MLVELDFFALNLALPDMARELETTTANLQWVISGYMLALAAFLIPGGAPTWRCWSRSCSVSDTSAGLSSTSSCFATGALLS